MAHVRKAILPVAGLGTRFLPATKAMPKELLPVVDKPLVEYAVSEAREAGIEEFIFITSRGKTAMEDHFDCNPELERELERRGKADALAAVRASQLDDGKYFFVRQQAPLGLGHAVWCAKELIGDEPFAVLLPDDIILGEKSCMQQLIDTHKAVGGGHVIGVQQVPLSDTKKYGVLDVDRRFDGYVSAKGFCEKPDPSEAPSDLAAIGRYVLEPTVFAELDSKMKGQGGEIQLTDAIARTLGETPLYGCRFVGERFDCGDKLGFIKANIAFALRRDDLAFGVRRFINEISTQTTLLPPLGEEEPSKAVGEIPLRRYHGSRDF